MITNWNRIHMFILLAFSCDVWSIDEAWWIYTWIEVEIDTISLSNQFKVGFIQFPV